ncbi:MAG: 4-phosphopantetheinyl transferase [Flavobacteria bacterium RIFCSPLOWO2_12_FULL_31_7]|nr:MAG: 4-phosphopantetheinyl transferase [Flavobacteria bacterium RIFCSPLOWO2_12_FULL_31_7]
MPFFKEIHINKHTTAYFWKISEDMEWLFENVQLNEKSVCRIETMSSIEHKKGFLAVRMLLQHIGFTDFNLFYDEFGKPHLKMEDGRWKMEEKHISISHSHEFSCICISNQCIGIDLEKRKEKTLKIAPRFMDISHLENLSESDKIAKSTVVWGVKESVFKLKNEKGISFPKHISESPFQLEDKKGKAQLHFNDIIEDFNFHFDFVDDYVFVCVLQ